MIEKTPVPEIEITISANAENTLNLGNYSSAKRGVFISKKIRIPADSTSEFEQKTIEEETKKLQAQAEMQLSWIVQTSMKEFGNAEWGSLHAKVYWKARAIAFKLFGVVDPLAPKEPVAPAP